MTRSSSVLAGFLLAVCLPFQGFAWDTSAGMCDIDFNSLTDMLTRKQHPGESGGFLLTPSKMTYGPNEKLTLTFRHMEVTNGRSKVFKGFLLYGEGAGGARQGAFTWSREANWEGIGSPPECSNSQTTSHTNKDPKQAVTIEWTAPAEDMGDIEFKSLIYERLDFWHPAVVTITYDASKAVYPPTPRATRPPATVTRPPASTRPPAGAPAPAREPSREPAVATGCVDDPKGMMKAASTSCPELLEIFGDCDKNLNTMNPAAPDVWVYDECPVTCGKCADDAAAPAEPPRPAAPASPVGVPPPPGAGFMPGPPGSTGFPYGQMDGPPGSGNMAPPGANGPPGFVDGPPGFAATPPRGGERETVPSRDIPRVTERERDEPVPRVPDREEPTRPPVDENERPLPVAEERPVDVERAVEIPMLLDLVSATRELSTLSEVLNLREFAAVADALSGRGPFTVFAPTNDAFAAANVDLSDIEGVANVLKAHVVAGNYPASSFVPGETQLETLAGTKLAVNNVRMVVTAGGARVSKFDIQAVNAVVHIIDSVILPSAPTAPAAPAAPAAASCKKHTFQLQNKKMAKKCLEAKGAKVVLANCSPAKAAQLWHVSKNAAGKATFHTPDGKCINGGGKLGKCNKNTPFAKVANAGQGTFTLGFGAKCYRATPKGAKFLKCNAKALTHQFTVIAQFN